MSIGVLGRPFQKLVIILEMIKFEHTLFALPFALMSAWTAAGGVPPMRTLGWILAAMVGARSAAMTFNRIADMKIDAANPRTSGRALPRGLVSVGAAWAFTLVSAGLLVFAAYMLNPLAFALSPAALVAVLGYSYSKRFTSLSHLWLGLCLGIAPVGAWIAVTGQIGFASMVLSAAVMLWTAGFDVIYSLQDVEFDKKMGLRSLPERIGAAPALWAARLFHAIVVVLLAWFGLLCGMGTVFFVGAACTAVFLVYEHSLVSPTDLRRVNTAFFTMNGCFSVSIFLFTWLDLYL